MDSINTQARWHQLMALTLLFTSMASWAGDGRRSDDVIAVGLPLTAGAWALSQQDTDGLWMLGKTMVATVGSTQVLKYATQDSSWGTRPNGEDKSFPSGHTSAACAGAAFIGQRYGWRQGSLAMLPAAYVGWSRVDQDQHHVRDVVAGCALGVVSAVYFTQPNPDLTLTPFVDRKVWGVQIRSVW